MKQLKFSDIDLIVIYAGVNSGEKKSISTQQNFNNNFQSNNSVPNAPFLRSGTNATSKSRKLTVQCEECSVMCGVSRVKSPQSP